MDNPEDPSKEHAFPAGFEFIEEMAKEAREKIKVLDKQLDRTPREMDTPQSPVPRYNPPGFLKPVKPINPAHVVYDLEKKKETIEADVNKRVEHLIEKFDLDDETAKQLRQATLHTLHPNPFEGKSKKEMEMLSKVKKDINYSQDYMIQRKRNFQQEEKEKPSFIREEASKEKKPFSISLRFTQSLSYTKVQESNLPGIRPNNSKGKDLPGK
ncbi:hypothetical protein BWI97_13990 [Siphonobacter sp. BAB-5405]|uniref:hypothetical protein n=1 Tax=Siphonobacter sp. BAB-5405 TaxID=1864825 RepID=UPI000C7FC473|nr:hypothetical protein [Siphonobacter sp. BAB-5405]PMD95706.1 hypothetical protein BWI97_13990 [Siphonobacter sp. BAB-5405]